MNIRDHKGNDVLSIDKASANIEILPLFNKKIIINSMQLFSMDVSLNRTAPDSPLNIQFILDKLKSDKSGKSKWFLSLRTLIFRDCSIKYDISSLSKNKDGLLDLNHINIDKLNACISIISNEANNINLELKHLNFRETNTNTNVSDFNCILKLKEDIINIINPNIQFNNTQIQFQYITIDNYAEKNNINISGNIINSKITPSDFSFILPSKKYVSSSSFYSIHGLFNYSSNNLLIDDLIISSKNKDITFNGDIHVLNLFSPSIKIDAKISQMSINISELIDNLYFFNINKKILNYILKLGNIKLNGSVNYKPNYIQANANISSSTLGVLNVNGCLDGINHIKSKINCNSLNINKIANNIPLYNISADLYMDMFFTKDFVPIGILKGTISNINYDKYNINNITIDGKLSENKFNGYLLVRDKNINGEFNGYIDGIQSGNYSLKSELKLNQFTPSNMFFKGDISDHTIDLLGQFEINGSSLSNLNGKAEITKFGIKGEKYNLNLNNLLLSIVQSKPNYKSISIQSEIIKGKIDGYFSYQSFLNTILNNLNQITSIFGYDNIQTGSSSDKFKIDITAYNSTDFIQFIKFPFGFNDSINIKGFFDNNTEEAEIYVNANSLYFDKDSIQNLILKFKNNSNNYNVACNGNLIIDNRDLSIKLNADGKGNNITSQIDWILNQERPISGRFNINGLINYDNNHIAQISLKPSTINILDHFLNIEANDIDIYNDHIQISELKAFSDNRSININGSISSDPSDSIYVDMDGTTLGNVFELANFNVPNIDGFVYGKCVINNLLQSPRVNANLYIDNLSFKNNNLGHAYIIANWDNNQDGIRINTNLIKDNNHNGITSINGYIYPEDKLLDMTMRMQNADAAFLNGLLFRPFKNISGSINSNINIAGPFENLIINGVATTDSKLTLRATNVTYAVNPEDTIQIKTNSFTFDNIRISDKDNNTNMLNGLVSHEKFKNFTYEFDMHLADILLYDEANFNSDKFKGKIYADGTFHLKGSDGHPLYINSEIYPTKGSEFYYDASTPDAITTNSFLSFNEIIPTDSILIVSGYNPTKYWYEKDSLSNIDVNQTSPNYRGDIYMNLNIHMNNNCPVKMKMDNIEDGYITTYGNGVLHADYHNKGGFTLNGTYSIHEGKYRLYLQDIIYRDLILQDGSSVVFNGNPFDADIHLICWHTLQSVPLSDLTSEIYTQNNRVKVICILDITGHLGNMIFNFDLNLPNVSDETRHIVKSYISTEEEMNKQIIYLLGFGRFFTNDYARSNGETNTNQAVNSLLSSTLSGQINQILSNAMGNDSKWNFGTGISTGEKGWEDVDVEGTLSGKLLDDRLLINGNFGYRDNSLTNNSSFIGDFDVRWRLSTTGNIYLKAYNLTNDRYFTKSTLNTQGIGATYQRDFESWKDLFRRKHFNKNKDILLVEDSINNTTNLDSIILYFKSDSLNP